MMETRIIDLHNRLLGRFHLVGGGAVFWGDLPIADADSQRGGPPKPRACFTSFPPMTAL